MSVVSESERPFNPGDVVYESTDGRGEQSMVFHCPGCGYDHSFRVDQGTHAARSVWGWNKDRVRPTFSPSLLVNGAYPEQRCHSFVRDGKIEFLSDCWHELRGKTVALLPVSEWY
jgi:hypothetical protein